jgi:ribosomal-protein-alanine N-acetyltransferase
MIRAMHWSDIERVHALESEVFTVDPWTVEQFWSELAQPTRSYVVDVQSRDDVGTTDEVLLGYAGLFALAPDADLQTIAVSPGAHGLGIGTRLLESLLDQARAAGCRQMMLEVRSDNAAAIAMYSRFGFEQISVRRDYYAPSVDALIMRLRPIISSDSRPGEDSGA